MFVRRVAAQLMRNGTLTSSLRQGTNTAPKRMMGTFEKLGESQSTTIVTGAFGLFCAGGLVYAGSSFFGTFSEKKRLEDEKEGRRLARRAKLEQELQAEEKKACCKSKQRVSFPAALNEEWTQIYKEIQALLDNPAYDDGSFGPVLVRLAWHAAGTYDAINSKVLFFFFFPFSFSSSFSLFPSPSSVLLLELKDSPSLSLHHPLSFFFFLK